MFYFLIKYKQKFEPIGSFVPWSERECYKPSYICIHVGAVRQRLLFTLAKIK